MPDVWDTPLSKPIVVSRERTLNKLSDARDLILRLPEQRQTRPTVVSAGTIFFREKFSFLAAQT
jgi:hypothetical protein